MLVMIKIIKAYFRNSSFVLRINAIFQRVYYSRLKKEMIRRSLLDIFDYGAIAKPIKMLFIDKYPENNLYGMSYQMSLLKSNDALTNMDAYIEHGLFLGHYVARCSYKYKTNNIITFGKYREDVLLSNQNIIDNKKNIIAIGPYIAYAKSLLKDEELLNLKEELGKTLVVFPTHSIENMTTDFDNNQLVHEIERLRIAYQFKTIIICLYWKDIIDKRDICNSYLRQNYKIVCAGHKNDIFFLNRLHSIIKLSDVTMSNEVGTHVGYCIYLHKPHYIFKQSIAFKEGFENVLRTENMDLDLYSDRKICQESIESLFITYSENITEKQKEIINYYWGTSKILDKEEFLRLNIL